MVQPFRSPKEPEKKNLWNYQEWQEHLQQIPSVFCQWGKWKTSLMHFQSALTSAKTALHGKGLSSPLLPPGVVRSPWTTIMPLERHFAHSTLLERPSHQWKNILESGMLRDMFQEELQLLGTSMCCPGLENWSITIPRIYFSPSWMEVPSLQSP